MRRRKGSPWTVAGYIALFSLAAVVVACGNETPPQPQQPQRVERPAPKVEVERIEPELEGVEAERPPYSPEGRRDPFKPFIVQARMEEEEEEREPKTPLERYSLSQLKLVAILWGIDGAVAMVEDPEGKGYSIRVGTPIGNRNGRVKRILKDRVVVEERSVDIFGREQKEEVILELPRDEEELFP